MREILLRRRKGAIKLGFSIRGGKEHGIGFFVSDVEIGSEAYLQGLRTGDEIIRVNGFSLRYAVHSDVIGLFRNSGNLNLTVQNAGILPVKKEKSDLHYLPALVPSSPSQAEVSKSNTKSLEQQTASSKDDNVSWKEIPTPSSPLTKKTSINENVEMKLFLDMTNHQELGCTICKGPPEQPGIFIHSIKEKSLAYDVGLLAGDQIVQVNHQSFRNIDFQTAVKYLKTQKQLEIVMIKGSGREFIPAESSGYNSSSSSLNGETNSDDYPKSIQSLVQESKKDSEISASLSEDETEHVYSCVNSDNQVISKNSCKTDKQDTQSDFKQVTETLGSPNANSIEVQETSSDKIINSIKNLEEPDLTEDKDDEESVVEEIRKAAEEELKKQSWEVIDTHVTPNQKKPMLKDQEVQTAECFKNEVLENISSEVQINNPKSGHIWQRTVIAEIHNNPLPVPPPLPKENFESKTKLQTGIELVKMQSNLSSKGNDAIPPKMAEEMKKMVQHDQLIEEVKQVHKTLQQNHLQNGNRSDDDRNGLKPCIWQNNNNLASSESSNNLSAILRPKEIKSTRRGPLVTIGTYGETGSRRTPNRFSFLSNKQSPDPPKTVQVDNFSEKNNFTTYTTIIHNGPMKSTAVIDTSDSSNRGGINTSEPNRISRFDQNKVTIKVPAANYQNNQSKPNAKLSIKQENSKKQDYKSALQKHLAYVEDIPIIIEERTPSQNENTVKPIKLFSTAETNGREILLYSIRQTNLNDLEIEGGLNSRLGNRIIVSSVNKSGDVYKMGLVKGDQLMWINDFNLNEVTLSQARNILKTFSYSKEPINLIVAKVHPGLFDDVEVKM